MKRCPICNGEFEDRRIFCPSDGVTLRTVETEDALVGRVLDGKYAVEERLGHGGMGAVYRARHLLIGDDVAIKVLRPEMAENEDAVERMRREARAARHLRNPHTITVIDFSATEDGLVYLVMEFVKGCSLRAVLDAAGVLDVRRAASIVRQIAEGLDHAHHMGVVHRDLKPDNVMLEEREDGADFVRVLDFGIAKLSGTETKLRTLTNEDVILGTPCYLSPEQCGGAPVGPWSDVYSLAVMLFELVTGDVPFDGRSALDVARKHLFAEPRSPRLVNPALTERMAAVILKALAKEPGDRHPSAGALAADFNAAVEELMWSEVAPTIEVAANLREAGPVETVAALPRVTVPDAPVGQETGEDAGGERATRAGAPRGDAGTAKTKRLRPVLAVAAALFLVALGLYAVARFAGVGRPSPRSPFEGMVLVPAGGFPMGSETPRLDCQDEHPTHIVDLPDFYIDRTEVTNAQYRAFCDATSRPVPPPPGWDADYFLSKPDYPVINVTWQDANDYAKWVGKRLPTEAEWEKAARGTDGRTYPWGNELRPGATTVAGMADGFEYTAPVGSFPEGASPYGCVDMIGNVYEWVEDWYQPYPGSDGSWDTKGDTGFKKHVLRGGSFTARADLIGVAGGIARASERFCELPAYSSVNVGFRCAKTP